MKKILSTMLAVAMIASMSVAPVMNGVANDPSGAMVTAYAIDYAGSSADFTGSSMTVPNANATIATITFGANADDLAATATSSVALSAGPISGFSLSESNGKAIGITATYAAGTASAKPKVTVKLTDTSATLKAGTTYTLSLASGMYVKKGAASNTASFSATVTTAAEADPTAASSAAFGTDTDTAKGTFKAPITITENSNVGTTKSYNVYNGNSLLFNVASIGNSGSVVTKEISGKVGDTYTVKAVNASGTEQAGAATAVTAVVDVQTADSSMSALSIGNATASKVYDYATERNIEFKIDNEAITNIQINPTAAGAVVILDSKNAVVVAGANYEIKPGDNKFTITVQAANGNPANQTVYNLTVKATTQVTLTGVKIDKDAKDVKVGETITATTTPANASGVKYQWVRTSTAGVQTIVKPYSTEATYVVTKEDIGSTLKVTAQGTKADGTLTPAVDSGVTNKVPAVTVAQANVTIPAPVKGQTPKTTDEGTEWTATIAWTPADATFVEGKEYTAKATITPKDGYANPTKVMINGVETTIKAGTYDVTFAKVPTDGEVIGNVTSVAEISKVVPSYVGTVTADATDTTVVRLNQNILGMNLPVSVKWTADKAIATINNATNAVSFVRPAVGANDATRTVTFTPAVRAAGTGKVIVILAPNADPFTVQIGGIATATTVEVGTSLKAETDCQTTAKYEWLINGVKVSSSQTYTPKLSDNGKTIYVTVTDKNGVKVSSLQYTIVAEAQKVTITDLSAPRADATLDKVINTKNQAFTSANVQWFEVDDNNNQIKELTYFVADSGKKYQAVITLTGNNLPKSAKKETYAVSNGKIDFAKSVSNNGTNATIVVDYDRLGSNDMSSLKDAIVVAGTYYDKVEEDTKSANVYINRWWINLDSKNYNDAKDALNAFNIVAYNKAVATRDDLTSSSADIKDAKEGLEKAQKALVKYLLKGTKVLDDVSVVSVTADGKEYETTTTKLTVNLSKVTDDLTASDFSVKTGNKDQVIDVLSADHKSGSRTYTLTVEVTSLGANRVEEGTVATVSINRDGYKDSAASFKYHNKQLRRPVVTINKDKATIAQGGKKDQAKDTVKLYYTIDNSDPTIASTLYTGAVTIPKDGMTLRVVAIDLTGNYYESETANYKLEIGKDPEVSFNGPSTNTSGSSTTATPSNPVTPPASTTVTTAQTTVDTQKAIDAAVAAGAKTAALTYRNVTNLSTDVFAAINNVAAKTPGVAVTVNADTTVGGKIAARMYINPVGAKSINPTIDTVASSAANTQVSKTFAKFFKNDVRVATFAAKGDLGMKVNVAVKFDLTGLNKDSIHVYSYNAETNKYKLITAKAYVDANGYVHVATDRGNSLVITDSPLTAK